MRLIETTKAPYQSQVPSELSCFLHAPVNTVLTSQVNFASHTTSFVPSSLTITITILLCFLPLHYSTVLLSAELLGPRRGCVAQI